MRSTTYPLWDTSSEQVSCSSIRNLLFSVNSLLKRTCLSTFRCLMLLTSLVPLPQNYWATLISLHSRASILQHYIVMTWLNKENQELSEADLLKIPNLCLQLYWNRVSAQEIGKQRIEEALVQTDTLHSFILPLLQCAEEKTISLMQFFCVVVCTGP